MLTEKVEGREGLQSDSRTLVTTLLIRDIQRREGAVGVLVSEILDPRTQNLVKLAKMNDFICANDFVSMALAQMAEAFISGRGQDPVYMHGARSPELHRMLKL